MTLLALLSFAPAETTSSVVGGGPVSDGDWPDTAGIVFNGNAVDCTGTLIAPDVVVTAGHCVGGITHVLLDTVDYRQPGEKIRVASSHEYPNSWNTVDIAVLVLEKESEVEPRIIAQDCILDDHLRDGASVQIVGYGAIDIWGNDYVSTLMEATSQVADHDCSDMWRGCNASVSPGGEIGAGGDGVDACYGDSGGPLYLLTDKGHYLVGVTSRSYDNVYAPCEEGGIWGRPDYVIDWIEDTTGRTLPTPDCDGTSSGDNGAPVPSSSDLLVVVDGLARAKIAVNDPDTGDAHSFVLIEESVLGAGWVEDDGVLIVQPTEVGEETLRVKVTDDGEPAESGVVEIQVTVVEKDGSIDPGGCSTVPLGSIWLGLLAMLGLRRRD
ncbi:MAG: trypsin-like serine protease [Proteobacteria bacterium]|nr:trypsin-like serine protease [Pseudomonadota bacterium]MCP4917632.1 trypsin-like serine protease [Pseudomonadota bacterium]